MSDRKPSPSLPVVRPAAATSATGATAGRPNFCDVVEAPSEFLCTVPNRPGRIEFVGGR